MIISNNLPALNTFFGLKRINSAREKHIEKLSSGLRITKAAHDAAGLSISEKMRAQIRGLNQARRNVQDGISLIQVAESGLHEVHENLHKVRELTIQASSDTLTSRDRQEISREVQALLEHIDEIGMNTEFNRIKVLRAGTQGKTIISKEIDVTVGPGESVTAVTIEIPDPAVPNEFWIEGAFGTISGAQWPDLNVISPNGESFGYQSDFLTLSGPSNDTTNTSSEKAEYNGWGADVEFMTFTNPIAGEWVVEIRNTGGEATSTYTLRSNYPLSIEYIEEEHLTGPGLTDVIIQLGANSGQNMEFPLPTITTSELDIDGVNLDSYSSCQEALSRIDNAISQISSERARFGAYQNRLEHTMRSLGASAENLQAAESRIRDLDMAEEILAFTKNNIIQQAATAMLAQANMAPQSVLQLLGQSHQ